MLPEVLKGADLSKCAKVEYAGDEDIYQIGDYLIVKGDVDQSRLSDDYIFYMANGKNVVLRSAGDIFMMKTELNGLSDYLCAVRSMARLSELFSRIN